MSFKNNQHVEIEPPALLSGIFIETCLFKKLKI